MNWTLETRRIDELLEHEKNPRILTKKQAKDLAKSINQFGLIDKPIVTHDGRIIGGHQRIRVLRDMGHDCVECWVCQDNVNQQQIDELNIRLNKNTGEWNWDVLANEWDINFLCEWGFETKDFHDEDKGILEKKPRVILEFDDRESLDSCWQIIEELSNSTDKIKVKIKA